MELEPAAVAVDAAVARQPVPSRWHSALVAGRDSTEWAAGRPDVRAQLACPAPTPWISWIPGHRSLPRPDHPRPLRARSALRRPPPRPRTPSGAARRDDPGDLLRGDRAMKRTAYQVLAACAGELRARAAPACAAARRRARHARRAAGRRRALRLGRPLRPAGTVRPRSKPRSGEAGFCSPCSTLRWESRVPRKSSSPPVSLSPGPCARARSCACAARSGNRFSGRSSPCRWRSISSPGRGPPPPAPPDGDEPYYLLLTHSLADDGDVDLADEYREAAWRSFTTVPVAPQPGDPTGTHGEIYSRHSALLPLAARTALSPRGAFRRATRHAGARRRGGHRWTGGGALALPGSGRAAHSRPGRSSPSPRR